VQSHKEHSLRWRYSPIAVVIAAPKTGIIKSHSLQPQTVAFPKEISKFHSPYFHPDPPSTPASIVALSGGDTYAKNSP
jgi:hypothetical protein